MSAKKLPDERYRQQARAQFEGEGELEIDDNAPISRGEDPGAYVQAWVWVSEADARKLDEELRKACRCRDGSCEACLQLYA